MGLPISYTSGLSASWRVACLLAGGLSLVLAIFPEALALYRWLPALAPGYAQSALVFYVTMACVVSLLMLGLFGQQEKWSIATDGLTHVKSGWSGRKTRHYAFSAIAEVTAREYVTDGTAGGWRLHLRLKSGRRLSFRFGNSWDEVYQAKREIEDAMAASA